MSLKKFVGFTCFILILISLSGINVTATNFYNVTIEDGAAAIEAYYNFEHEEPGRWRTTVDLSMPESTVVHRVTDGTENISFEHDDNDLIFETPTTFSDEIIIKVDFNVEEVTSDKFDPVRKVDISLPGFKGKPTEAIVRKNDIISWYTDFNYSSSKADDEIKFKGEGGLPLIIYSSEQGNKTERYRYFGAIENMTEIEEMFYLIPYMTGINSPHDTYVLMAFDDDTYDDRVNTWSNGIYKRGGLIVVREEMSQPHFIATVVHETMHGFNSRILDWDRTGTSYYDEGMAKFLETLVYDHINVDYAEIFGNRTVFERDGSRFFYEPRGTPETLYELYKNDRDWMYRWSPDKGNRELGYAFSELLISRHVYEHGIEGLRNLSLQLNEIDEPVSDWEQKYTILKERMDMKPCFSEDKSDLINCVNEVNSLKFDLTEFDIDISEFEIKDEDVDIDIGEYDLEKIDSDENFLRFILNDIIDLMRGWIEWISKKL